MRRVRPALYVLGAALVVGSLVGARALTNGTARADGNGQPKTANPVGNGGAKVSGPIVLGTVDTDPQPIPYFLPPVLQSGTVVERFVTSGKEVKADDPLYKFDTSLQERDLGKAQATVAVAKSKVAEAEEGAKSHANKVELAKQAVAMAEENKNMKGKTYRLIYNNLEEGWRKVEINKKPLTDEEIKKRLDDDDRLLTAYGNFVVASREEELRKKELAALQAVDPQVQVRVAEAGVKLAEVEVKKAQDAIDLCTVRAKIAGTVERVTIGPGYTMGIGTREPALWLIPAGPRIVRAEVEAEFAHRVGPDLKGKEVTIYDNTNPQLTYKGVVREVGGTFLPKRSSGEASLLGNDTRVLEAVVEVADPAPAGKPPLRVGQRVRVSLGQ
jgi:multidrug resistance efflux pump